MVPLTIRTVRESIFLDYPMHNADGVLIVEAAIWSIEQSGKLSALYKSAGGSTVVGMKLADLLLEPSQMRLDFGTFSFEGVDDLLNTRQGRLLIERD